MKLAQRDIVFNYLDAHVYRDTFTTYIHTYTIIIKLRYNSEASHN